MSSEELWKTCILVQGAAPMTRLVPFHFSDQNFETDDGDGWSVQGLDGYSCQAISGTMSRVTWHSYTMSYSLEVDLANKELKLMQHREVRPVTSNLERRGRGRHKGAWPQGAVTISTQSQLKGRKAAAVVEQSGLLPAILMTPEAAPQWTVIYLHGMNETAKKCYANHPHFFMDGRLPLKVVCLTAPQRELGCYDEWWEEVKQTKGAKKRKAWRLMRHHAWFDYLTHGDGDTEEQLDEESLREVRGILHGIVRHEAALLGGRYDRVILAGKSQGCCTALDAALQFPERLGGFFGIVGHLLSCTPVQQGSAQATTPLHFYHEAEDDIHQWSWVGPAEQRLVSAGFDVRSHRSQCPDGRGHYVVGTEAKWIRDALQSICGAAS